MFGIAVDSARSRAWATTAAISHVAGYTASDSGKAAVLRFNLVA
ncbi:MAG: hypothetical protein ABIZ73_04950 [Gemmatimonadaceae bacterium]